jgi:DNA-binding CsgD family transcriptional regulator
MVDRAHIVKARADWGSALEAAYDPGPDDRAWGDQLLAVVQERVFAQTDGLGIVVLEHDTEYTRRHIALSRGTGQLRDFASAGPAQMASKPEAAGWAQAFFYPPLMVTTQSEIAQMEAPETVEFARAQRELLGVEDLLGVVVHPEPGVALVVCATLEDPRVVTAHERRLLSQLGLHLAAAYRLRRRPEAVHAVVSLEGKVLDRALPDATEAIADSVRRIESSRSDSEDLFQLWTALVAGRYSLVRRTEGGRRRYLVLENSMQSQAMRALTRREVEVLSMAARGMPAKLIAYGLGLSGSTVSSALARAASKLGMSSRLELVRLAAAITGDPRANALPETVTAAEAEILELLGQGLSNREIARLRSRSTHTIANQIASLLRKTKSASRRALVAKGRK